MKPWMILSIFLVAIGGVTAGPNSEAQLLIDTDPQTIGIGSIEGTRSMAANGEVTIAVVANDVKNLDTYAFRLTFDRSLLTYEHSSVDLTDPETANILAVNGGTVCCQGTTILTGASSDIDTLEFYYSLVGTDTIEAPDGFGLVASVTFSSTLSPGASAQIEIASAEFVSSDYERDYVATLGSGTITLLPVYSLSVESTAGGTISQPNSSPVSIIHGSSTNIVAQENTGYDFTEWTVTGNGMIVTDPNASATTVVLTNGDATVTANYTLEQYSLSITADTGGSISQPSSSPVTVEYGVQTTLSAIAADDYHFSHWEVISGEGVTIADPNAVSTSVTLASGDAAIEALFEPDYTITVTAQNGSVGRDPMQSTYAPGTEVALTAIPDEGYHFTGWSGDLSGSTNPESVTLTGDLSITAEFELKEYQLEIVAGSGGSIVEPSTSPVTVSHGVATALEAQPDEGFVFSGWTTAESGVNFDNASAAATEVRLTAGPATITANFTQQMHTLSVATTGEGVIMLDPPGPTYPEGNTVTLNAAANDGWFFAGWSGQPIDGVRDTVVTIVMDASYSVGGEFVEGGAIAVDGLSSEADVYIHASHDWVGQKTLDGNGTIHGLRPGFVSLCVMEPTKRTEYFSVEVTSGATTSLSVTMRPRVPLTIGATEDVLVDGAPLATLEPTYAVSGDFDRDGDDDLLLGNEGGSFDYYAKTGTDFQAVSAPMNSTGSLLSVPAGIRGLKGIDRNSDGRLDILVADGNGDLTIFPNVAYDGSLTFDDGIVVATYPGITGFDVGDLNADGAPDLVLGFDDGTIHAAPAAVPFDWGSPSWEPATALQTSESAIDVGDRAIPCLVSLDGSERADLIAGNGDGALFYFRAKDYLVFQDRGFLIEAGDTAQVTGAAMLANYYNTPGELPGLLLTEETGQVCRTGSTLRGNFNATAAGSEEKVDLYDLQEFGDAWMTRETDTEWDAKYNLDLSEDGAGLQIIDVMDLAVFGDCWLKEK